MEKDQLGMMLALGLGGIGSTLQGRDPQQNPMFPMLLEQQQKRKEDEKNRTLFAGMSGGGGVPGTQTAGLGGASGGGGGGNLNALQHATPNERLAFETHVKMGNWEKALGVVEDIKEPDDPLMQVRNLGTGKPELVPTSIVEKNPERYIKSGTLAGGARKAADEGNVPNTLEHQQRTKYYNEKPSMSVTQSVGDTTVKNIEPTKAVETGLQKDLISASDSLSKLKAIQGMVADNPEFLEVGTQWEQTAQSVARRLGWKPEEATVRYREHFADFSASVSAMLNQYINDLSGAAVSPEEAERLLKTVASMGDDIDTFNGKMRSMMRTLSVKTAHRTYALQHNLITEQATYGDLIFALPDNQFKKRFVAETETQRDLLIEEGLNKDDAWVQAKREMRQKYGL